jgi:hypothetical protein
LQQSKYLIRDVKERGDNGLQEIENCTSNSVINEIELSDSDSERSRKQLEKKQQGLVIALRRLAK